jgi:hypothetical protein
VQQEYYFLTLHPLVGLRMACYTVLSVLRVLRSSKTGSRHLSLGHSLLLEPSGWYRVIFLKGTWLSIFAICHSHFSLAVLIIFSMLGSLYKLHNSSARTWARSPTVVW